MSITGFKEHTGFAKWVSFCILLLLCRDFIVVPVVYAQDSPVKLLQAGITAYDEARFETAIEKISKALTHGLKKKEDIINAYRYKAFSFAALRDAKQAKASYLELLDFFPEFKLDGAVSPALRRPFLAALKIIAARDTAQSQF